MREVERVCMYILYIDRLVPIYIVDVCAYILHTHTHTHYVPKSAHAHTRIIYIHITHRAHTHTHHIIHTHQGVSSKCLIP